MRLIHHRDYTDLPPSLPSGSSNALLPSHVSSFFTCLPRRLVRVVRRDSSLRQVLELLAAPSNTCCLASEAEEMEYGFIIQSTDAATPMKMLFDKEPF